MNTTEIRNYVKDTAAQMFIDAFPNCAATIDKDYQYVFPVEVDGKTVYAKFTLTTCAWADTKSKPAFNFEEETLDAQGALEDIQMERAKKAAESEAKKSKSKTKKKKDEDEE